MTGIAKMPRDGGPAPRPPVADAELADELPGRAEALPLAEEMTGRPGYEKHDKITRITAIICVHANSWSGDAQGQICRFRSGRLTR
jgi:hypothetical protein